MLGKYPNLKLSLAETLSGATLMHLMASEVDLALAYNPPSDKDLIAEPVLEEQMFCVVTVKLIGKSREPITFEGGEAAAADNAAAWAFLARAVG